MLLSAMLFFSAFCGDRNKGGCFGASPTAVHPDTLFKRTATTQQLLFLANSTQTNTALSTVPLDPRLACRDYPRPPSPCPPPPPATLVDSSVG